jgi:hypothetical protein
MLGFKESLWSLATTSGTSLSVATPWVRVGATGTGGFCYLTPGRGSRQVFQFYYLSLGMTVGLSALPIPSASFSSADFPSKSEGYLQLNPSMESAIAGTIRDVNIDDFTGGIAMSLTGAWFGATGSATLYAFTDRISPLSPGFILPVASIRALTWQLSMAVTTPDLSVGVSCQAFSLSLANKKPIRL